MLRAYVLMMYPSCSNGGKSWRLTEDADADAKLDIIWSIMKETEEEESETQMAIQRLKNRLVREVN